MQFNPGQRRPRPNFSDTFGPMSGLQTEHRLSPQTERHPSPQTERRLSRKKAKGRTVAVVGPCGYSACTNTVTQKGGANAQRRSFCRPDDEMSAVPAKIVPDGLRPKNEGALPSNEISS
jgi:hypothetical protein